MKNKIISLFVVVVMILSSVPMTVFAQSSIGSNADNTSLGEDYTFGTKTEYAEVGISDTQTQVYLTVEDNNLIASLPTTIIVSGTPNPSGEYIGEYSIGVSGDMAGDKIVTIKPESNTIALKQSGKNDKTAEITQEQTEFDTSDFKNNTTTTGKVTAKQLTAGSWNGVANFVIGIKENTGLINTIMNNSVNNEMLYSNNGYLYVGSRNRVNKIDLESGNIVNEYFFERPDTSTSTYLFTGLGEKEDYLYACSRVELAGTNENENDTTLGDLYVFNKNDLSLVSKTSLEAKGSRILIDGDTMIVACQMYGYNIYDISNPSSPRLLYSYRMTKGTEEYQGGDIYDYNGHKYYVSAAFGFGLYIDDITETVSSNGTIAPTRVGNFKFAWYPELKNNVHTYDVIVEYPNIYTTVASSKVSDFGTEKDIRGLLKVNIEDIIRCTTNEEWGHISYNITQVPDEYKAISNIGGDTKPSRMIRLGNYVITNGGNNGAIIFDISKNTPEFYKFIPTNDTETNTICSTDNYIVFGAFNSKNPIILVYDKNKIIK